MSRPEEGSVTKKFATYVHNVSSSDLSPRLRSFIKQCILDTVGCMLAGTTTAAGRIGSDFAQRLSERSEARIVRGKRVAVERAAFANTLFGNANDFEPVGPEGHVIAVCVPATLALAEWTGASGASLLVAIAAGCEVSGRVGAAFRRPSSIAASGLPAVRGTSHAIFAATIPAAKLLGLSETQICDAIGIAAYSAPLPTLRKALDTPVPPMTKYDHLALQAQTGIEAARLAQCGFSGDRAAFEGEFGMWRFSGSLDCDWDFLTADLGGEWVVDATFFKPYPSVLYLLPSIEAVLEVIRNHELKPAEIEQISIHAQGLHGDFRSVDEPLGRWVNLPLNVAHAIYGTQPFTDWINIHPRAEILDLAERISINPLQAERVEYWRGQAPAEVIVRARNREYHGHAGHLPRLEPAAISEKFLLNAAPVVGSRRAREIAGLIDQIEDLPSIAPLAAALA
jgi:2-methylcitrate dehydratase PrpD